MNADEPNGLDNYHKRHLPGCRKVMYDPQSSPCSCLLEFERVCIAHAAGERYCAEMRERVKALELRNRDLMNRVGKAIRGANDRIAHHMRGLLRNAVTEWENKRLRKELADLKEPLTADAQRKEPA